MASCRPRTSTGTISLMICWQNKGSISSPRPWNGIPKRHPMRFTAAVFLFLFCLGASAQDKEQGSCDVSAQREKRTLEYNVEDRSDTDSTFVSKTPCTGETI